MLFCPFCGVCLLVDQEGMLKFFCPTCPYIFNVTRVFTKGVPLKKKVVDDVLGGDDAWKNVDSTKADCPSCGHDTAFYLTVQIRSADEPSTIFFRCAKCGHNWREG
ncbi:DNA-directed RNA polymerase subunit/transcription factor S like protein [Aduncisulcus paluster]|uniref:DNA-directed RNA polymerase subunit n=1 Tax=Aduncisulcus paluster TaxID=2918883 RepID=A0ABQ5KQJ8_9EUKA|nr:DNA-directed RNA polymerase subunit/transcription factor S like protein [Aduncisulcus paluster]